MEKFQLSVLLKIIGIGSASGLLYQNDLLYIISDNSDYLYQYNISNEKLNRIPLVENAQDNLRKSEKLDFEAITYKDNAIVVLGSGSTKERNWCFTYKTESKKVLDRDFTFIYNTIKSQLNIKDDELNIEGFAVTDQNMYFFQRGNGINTKNGIIYADDKASSPKFKFAAFDLPKIKNVPATFTDAIIVGDKFYFLASAEDTASTYEDGEVLGSLIGTIDIKTLKLEKTLQISDKHKFEGLTLFRKNTTELEFLLCEDTDTEVSETNIYKLTLDFKQ